MSLGMLQPQQLICTIECNPVPIVGVWFLGGRGTDAHPLEVEVLGDLAGEAAPRVVSALERLLESHGPFLEVDLSRVDHLQADGFEVPTGLRAHAANGAGRVRLFNLPPPVRHLTVATTRKITIDKKAQD